MDDIHFDVLKTIATAVIAITILNVIIYILRRLHRANFLKNSDISSSQQPQEADIGEKLCRHFTLSEILAATNNFDDTLVIGQGGFGKVYKGIIDNIKANVAIKRLNPMSRQGAPQFWTEIELLSRFRHSHLVSLIGYCNDHSEMTLVYEYMANGALADHLYKVHRRGSDNDLTLSWIQRLKICIGAAQGLDYLHTGTGIQDRVVHRDLKSSNILLDENWAAKISDFGLSRICPANQNSTHVSTNVKGTFGYVDPEYLLTRRLTRKSDVFSFGVVLLEVLSGRRAVDLIRHEEQWGLAGWSPERMTDRELDQILDPYLKCEILPSSLKVFVQVAEKCLNYSSKKRPTMAEVVALLESALALQERRNTSLFEEDFLNLSWTSDNQENLDDSRRQPEVNNTGNGGGDIILSRDASNSKSRGRSARFSPLKRMARLFYFGKSQVDTVNETSNSISLQFDLGTIRTATDNFSPTNKLGEGRFGVVYRGRLQDGRDIAVKELFSYSLRAELVFRNESLLVGKLQHRNLVAVLGFCSKGTERFLVYEFVPNSSLEHYIHDPVMRPNLDWEWRSKIIRGVARGLLYVHEDSPVRIIHCHLHPSNILLDAVMNPKISGFGTAKLLEGEEIGGTDSNISWNAGLIAPEVPQTLSVSTKSDVFSFGMLILVIVSGRGVYSSRSEEIPEHLRIYVLRNWLKGTYSNVIDPQLSASQISVYNDEIRRCIQIGLLCVQDHEADRPTMSLVVLMLNNSSIPLPEPSGRASFVG